MTALLALELAALSDESDLPSLGSSNQYDSLLGKHTIEHGRRNHRDSGDMSPPYFGKLSAISKTVRQRSVRQTVQKLQLIMIFDFCKALLTIAMKKNHIKLQYPPQTGFI